MQKWQHCRLEGNRVHFMGASGVFDNKSDAFVGERSAWSRLEEAGWELVSVANNADGVPVYYFKRLAPTNRE